MAYVAPNSTLQLFKGINLDNRYLHTIYFANATAQDTWFTGKVFKTYNNMMYRRYTSEAVKVEADASELLGVTYMRFRNTRTASKWFYAFVNYVDYVNENTAVIYYEIDVMQTWFIQNGSVRPCMVLREHTNDDTFTHNLEVEPVGSDCYDTDYLTNFDGFGNYTLVAQTTGQSVNQHSVQGIFSGCKYYTHVMNRFPADADDAYDDIQDMLGSWNREQQAEEVVDLYMVPTFCTGGSGAGIGAPIVPQDTIRVPSSYDNYTPKNKKLFMYPFSFLYVTTHTGDSAPYRWEYFSGGTGSPCDFKAEGTMIGGGEVRCFPLDYNGQTENIDAGLLLNNFPKCTMAYDAYQAWIAGGGNVRLDNQRVVDTFKGVGGIMPSLGGMVRSLFGGGSGGTTTTTTYEPSGTLVNKHPVMTPTSQTVTERTNPANFGASTGHLGSIISGVGNLIEARNNLEYTFKDARYAPNIVVGKPSGSLPFANRDANFYFYHCHVRDDEAKRIDDFFSCYGYATNKVKQPNLTGRAYWNFVQTEGAVIAGDMPSSSKEAIGRIFNSGITFWHNGDNVGNYAISTSNGSINNPIV